MKNNRLTSRAGLKAPRILALLLTCCLLFPALPSSASVGGGKAVAPGDIITFGHYEQDNNKANGKEPIRWIILAAEGDRALLVSEKALDGEPYHDEYDPATWESCPLRQRLNGEFLSAAFSLEEQKRVLTVKLNNEDNTRFNTEGGNDTSDRLFLLSISEAEKYFKDDDARRALNTAYAKAKGAYDDDGFGWWWLRSPGDGSLDAANVNVVGSVTAYGSVGKTGEKFAVRPALYVDLTNGNVKPSTAGNLWETEETPVTPLLTTEGWADIPEKFQGCLFQTGF